MPDDFRHWREVVPHLWSMNDVEDLLRHMWKQGEFEQFGIGKNESFNRARAEEAFGLYWESELQYLHTDLLVPAVMEDPVDIILAGSASKETKELTIEFVTIGDGEFGLARRYDPALDDYVEGKSAQELAHIYYMVGTIFSDVLAFDDPESFDGHETALGYAEVFQYLTALESGESLPFQADGFDPDLLKNYAAQAGFGADNYKDLASQIPEEMAPFLAIILGNIDETSSLYYLREMALEFGVSEDALVPPIIDYGIALETSRVFTPITLSPEDAEILSQVFIAALPEGYTPEQAALLSNQIFNQALYGSTGELIPEQIWGRYARELQEQQAVNDLFLYASEFDKSRLNLYLTNAGLPILSAAIAVMPDEIIGIPVGHIKSAFENYLQLITQSTVKNEDEVTPEEIYEQELFFEQLAPDGASLLPTILELGLSMLWEPFDWYLSGRDVLQGNWLALSGFLPIIPGALGKRFDDVPWVWDVDATADALRQFRWENRAFSVLDATESHMWREVIELTTQGPKTIQFKTGHSFFRPHRSGTDLRQTSLTFSQVENAIVDDVHFFLDSGGVIPTRPMTHATRTVIIGKYHIGYHVIQGTNGTIYISTYYLK